MPLSYAVCSSSNRQERERAADLLGRVGLGDRGHHEPSQLSGGQQQRLAIARALVNHPPILLADEPTGNLDSKTSVEILDMFRRLNREEGITLVLVTHDMNVARYADRIIFIKDGLIADPTWLSAYEPPVARSQNGSGSNGALRGNGVVGDNGLAHRSEHPESGNGNAPRLAPAEIARIAVAATAPVVDFEPNLVAQLEVETAILTEPAPAEAPGHAKPVVDAVARRGPSTRPDGSAVRLVPRTVISAVVALRRNVFRSALTALGIIIGVAAVIAVIEIGQGSAAAMKQTMASMGANILQVMPGTASSGGVSFGSGSVMTLTPQDGDAILREAPSVAAVAPIVRARCQIVYGNRNWVPMQINGSAPEFLKIRDWENMAEGAAFTDRDVRNGTAVCLLGQTVATNLFGDESPVGKDVRIQNVSFRVVGVLSRKGANTFGMDQDDFVLAPWTTIKSRVSGATLANTNQSSSVQANSNQTTQQVNSLNGRIRASATRSTRHCRPLRWPILPNRSAL